jgi:hypothetical protein
MMNSRWMPAVLALALPVTACDADPIADRGDDFTPRTSVTLPVAGHGAVTSRFTAEVAVRGEWAYTTTWGVRADTGNAIFIWNVSGATPVLRDSVIVPGAVTLGDVQISDDGALLVVPTEYNDGSIVIFDRTVPDRLVQLSRFQSANTSKGVHTAKLGRVNGRLYAFLSIDPATNFRARLVVLDLGDPSNPVELVAREMGNPFVHDVYVRDGLLFTALWKDGLAIWDIGGGSKGGSPANPVMISAVGTVGGNAHNIWWFHDPVASQARYVFVGEEGPGSVGAASSGDIHVVDNSDITKPKEVAYYTVAGAGTHNFFVDEPSQMLFAAYYNGGVRAIDVKGDLGACAASARATDGRCNLTVEGREAGKALTTNAYIWGVASGGSRVFASDMLSGLYEVDVSALLR